jgi:hypothetical protein
MTSSLCRRTRFLSNDKAQPIRLANDHCSPHPKLSAGAIIKVCRQASQSLGVVPLLIRPNPAPTNPAYPFVLQTE